MFIDEFNLESSTDIIKSYLVDGGSTWRKPYTRLSKYKYNGANDSQAFEKHIRIDPLLGVENDFDYPDYCVASLNNHLESRVLFVPSIRVGQIGQGISTISFPGVEGMRQEDITATRYRNSLGSVFAIVETLMGGFGKRIVSYSRIYSPFKVDDHHQSWIEDSDKIFITENQCLLFNELLLNGLSEGPGLLNGFQTDFSIDRNGNVWTFVEYSAINFGGEYIPCRECLSAPQKQRQWYQNINDLVDLPYFQTCRNDPNRRQSLVYNYALTVHHPSVVASYRL